MMGVGALILTLEWDQLFNSVSLKSKITIKDIFVIQLVEPCVFSSIAQLTTIH